MSWRDETCQRSSAAVCTCIIDARDCARNCRQRFFFWESVLQLQTLALVAVDVFGRGMPVVSQPCCYVRYGSSPCVCRIVCTAA